jgi:hypothetical protein
MLQTMALQWLAHQSIHLHEISIPCISASYDTLIALSIEKPEHSEKPETPKHLSSRLSPTSPRGDSSRALGSLRLL